MTDRKRSAGIEIEVLMRSQRRCCICFGLHGDLDIKRGQLAHLDHDPSNTSEDNLCFLCLDHHDQYDSKTSQSKSFQIAEVKKYRSQLYDRLDKEPATTVSDGVTTQPDWDLLSARQKNAVMLDKPHECSFCGYGFTLTPRLRPNQNVYVKEATCPKCRNVDSVGRFYEA